MWTPLVETGYYPKWLSRVKRRALSLHKKDRQRLYTRKETVVTKDNFIPTSLDPYQVGEIMTPLMNNIGLAGFVYEQEHP
jgi:hypothetical protein